ncbi:ATP-dependent Clp protease proteolytic subunit [Paenibacillus sp. MCAF20]
MPKKIKLIHNASTSAWGDKGVMEQGRGMLSSTDEAIANAYEIKTGMNRDELLAMMDKETWLNAQKAVEMGFADEIMFSEAAAAVVNSASKSAVLPPEVIDKIRNELMKNLGGEGLDLTKMLAGSVVNNLPAQPENLNKNKEDDTKMDFTELKEKHPNLVNEIMTGAITAERSRIAALNDMAGAPGAAAFIKDAIANGETAGDVAMKIVKASADRISQEAENRQKDAKNSGAEDVDTQQPADQKAEDEAAEDAAVDNMIQYATNLINKKGGRG